MKKLAVALACAQCFLPMLILAEVGHISKLMNRLNRQFKWNLTTRWIQISEKVAENGSDWPKWLKMPRIECFKSHTKLHIRRQLTIRRIQISNKNWPKLDSPVKERAKRVDSLRKERAKPSERVGNFLYHCHTESEHIWLTHFRTF